MKKMQYSQIEVMQHFSDKIMVMVHYIIVGMYYIVNRHSKINKD